MLETIKAYSIVEPASSFRQLGILVLDGSASMTELCENNQTKAEATAEAASGLIYRLGNESSERSNFWGAAVAFDTTARVLVAPTPVVELAGQLQQGLTLNPVEGDRRGTYLAAGLAEALRIAETFIASGSREIHTSIVIVLMSDGRDQEHITSPDLQAPIRTADQIKQMRNVTLCTTYLATAERPDNPDAIEMLRQIATPLTTLNHGISRHANDLRDFFERSVGVEA